METVGDTPRMRAAMRAHFHDITARRQALTSLVTLTRAVRGASSLAPSCVAAFLPEAEAAGLAELLSQLGEFGESFQSQVGSSVAAPLQALQASSEAAVRRARAFDEDSEALDAAQRSFLSAPTLEARGLAHQGLEERRASASLSLLETRAVLREASGEVFLHSVVCYSSSAVLGGHSSKGS